MENASKVLIALLMTSTTLSAFAGISVVAAWNKAEIRVCFGDETTTTRLAKLEIRKPATSLFVFKALAVATTGVQGISPLQDYPFARGATVFTASALKNKTAIIHEFGHIIGLKHELESWRRRSYSGPLFKG